MAEDRSFVQQIADRANAVVDRVVIFVTGTTPALIAAAAVFAYLNQNSIRFIDAYRAYEAAFAFGAALVLLAAAVTVRRDWLGLTIGVAILILGVVWIGDALDIAVKRAAMNDSRCLQIELTMLKGKSTRVDLPNLYQALGCRPLSELPVSMGSTS